MKPKSQGTLQGPSGAKRAICCLLSTIGQAADSRIATMAAVLETACTPVVTIMPGKRLDAGAHVRLPAITAFLWRNSSFLNIMRAFWQRLRNSVLLFREVARLKPTLCICIEPDSWLIAVIARFLYGSRVAVDLQEYYPDRSFAFPTKLMQRWAQAAICSLMKTLSRSTDLIIHVSPDRDEIYNWLAPTKEIVYMLYPAASDFNGVDGNEEHHDGRVFLAHAGPLRPAYASNELLQAMMRVRDAAATCTLRVWGGLAGMPSASKRDCNELVNCGALVVNDSVPRAEVLAGLQSCDIGLSLVLPIDNTHVYAQPRKLYEYMAVGLPVIGSDVPTIRRIITEHKCGVLVDARDPGAIANAIVRLTQDADLRKTLGANGRRAIDTCFNPAIENARLITAIQALLCQTAG